MNSVCVTRRVARTKLRGKGTKGDKITNKGTSPSERLRKSPGCRLSWKTHSCTQEETIRKTGARNLSS